MRFFRVQGKGYNFEETKQHASADGGDGQIIGLAVSGSPNGIDGGARFGGAWDAMDDDDEVVVLEGRIITEIYDGYRIIPTAEIARFTIVEWKALLDSSEAYEYEE